MHRFDYFFIKNRSKTSDLITNFKKEKEKHYSVIIEMANLKNVVLINDEAYTVNGTLLEGYKSLIINNNFLEIKSEIIEEFNKYRAEYNLAMQLNDVDFFV